MPPTSDFHRNNHLKSTTTTHSYKTPWEEENDDDDYGRRRHGCGPVGGGMGGLYAINQRYRIHQKNKRGLTHYRRMSRTDGKLRRHLHAEHYIEQQLGLDIWEWKLDKLIALSVDLAYRVGLHRTLNLPLLNFCSYLQALADQYIASNTYHNFAHATDVLLVLCHLLLPCGGSSKMTEWEVAACFLAAHAHDVGHPGTNNQYQIAAKTALGEKYGAAATLEFYSAELGQQLLDEYHILSNISPQDRAAVLSTFKLSILGTDMGQHHNICLALKLLPNDFYTQNYPPTRPGKATNGDSTHELSLPALLLHAADISGASRQNAEIWLTRSLAVIREFVSQGDSERANQIPVTASFDRQVLQPEGLEGFQRRENEFTEGFVLPYYRDLERVWIGIKPLRIATEQNLKTWEELDRKYVSRMWGTIFV